MDIPTDAAPLDDAHLDDSHARVVSSSSDSLRYRILLRLLAAHDPDNAPPEPPPGPVEMVAEHIAEVERRCAEILRHLHPDERERIEPMLPIDLRPH